LAAAAAALSGGWAPRCELWLLTGMLRLPENTPASFTESTSRTETDVAPRKWLRHQRICCYMPLNTSSRPVWEQEAKLSLRQTTVLPHSRADYQVITN